MADKLDQSQSDQDRGSKMPARNLRNEEDMGGREGAGAQGDAADRAEVDRPDLNNQDVE